MSSIEKNASFFFQHSQIGGIIKKLALQIGNVRVFFVEKFEYFGDFRSALFFQRWVWNLFVRALDPIEDFVHLYEGVIVIKGGHFGRFQIRVILFLDRVVQIIDLAVGGLIAALLEKHRMIGVFGIIGFLGFLHYFIILGEKGRENSVDSGQFFLRDLRSEVVMIIDFVIHL